MKLLMNRFKFTSTKRTNVDIELLSKASHADVTELVERAIDPFGPFQKLIIFIMCWNSLIVGSSHTLTSYHSYTPENYTCRSLESLSNETCVPGCVEYDFFDSGSSVVTEWNLVCERRYLSAMSTTVYFIGVTVGSLVCGIFADMWGRRKLVLICLYIQGIFGAGVFFAGRLEIFMILRAIQGFFVQGLHSVSYVHMQEMNSTKNLTRSGLSWELTWTCGVILVGALAYLIPDWKWLQLAITSPVFFTFFWIWLLPESPKWFLSKNKKVEAIEGAINLAEKNNDKNFFAELQNMKPNYSAVATKETPPATAKMIDLFTHRILLKHTLVMVLVWFSITLGYFAILLYMSSLPGGRHLNFILGGVVEIFGCLFAYVILKSFLGRKKSMIILQYSNALLCVGLGACFFLNFTSNSWLPFVTSGLAILAKACGGAAFAGMFIYGAELFPTAVRGSAIGICGFAARMGCLLAPQIVFLGEVTHEIVPMAIIVGCLLASATATILVPETLNKVLPNTIDDVDKTWGKH